MFKPVFNLTPKIAKYLMRIAAIREEFYGLPITPRVLSSLRESARLAAAHYSTQIEGNRLTQEEVFEVIKYGKHIPGCERDEKEISGYYVAQDEIEQFVEKKKPLTQEFVKKIHTLVMGGGKKKVKPTPYRDGQNVIRDGNTHKIVYLPPEAKDVPSLMSDLVKWVQESASLDFPYPLIAAIAHYQFATIHPYYDGNGRTARLLTTLILHQGKYDLKGVYTLEECYAKKLQDYYQALDIGPSHNYYLGRATADITPWLDYFCCTMLESFEKVKIQALQAFKQGDLDKSVEIKKLDLRQRQALSVIEKLGIITSKDIERHFKISGRLARALCKQWVEDGFLIIVDPAKKSRKYALSPELQKIFT